MSSEVTIYDAPLPERKDYATTLAQSELLPEAYRGNPANVLVAVEAGQALGIPPIQALQSINVIKGKPSLSAELMSALVRKAGHKLRVEGDATQASAVIIRADDPEYVPEPVVWTLERAQRAGITSNPVWQQYPEAMLKARAVSEAARAWAPDALMGMSYTPEEVESMDLPATPAPVQQKQPRQPVSPLGFAPTAPADVEVEVVTDTEQAETPEWAVRLHELIGQCIDAGISDSDLEAITLWASKRATADPYEANEEAARQITAGLQRWLTKHATGE